MAYVSLYRKYRSQTFGDLIGQDHVVRTLQNALSSSRIAHAYLFTGPRGTGKTSAARLLAKCLCCEKGPGPEPCNECEICIAITEGSCIDVVEMDAASQTGIDDVREKIVQVVEYMPALCRYKVFVIDEVHDLSAKAFDALLKTIEEPPAHMYFVLATTEYNKVPPTIRSRCQKFEFHRASMDNLLSRLEYVVKQEGVEAEPAALSAIARMADGGYRDALTLLEQAVISANEGKVTLAGVYDQLGLVAEDTADNLLEALAIGDMPAITGTMEELSRVGRDPLSVVESLLYRVSDLTRIVFGVESASSGDATRHASSHAFAARLGHQRLLEIRIAIAEAHRQIRDISLPRLWLESEFIRISQPLSNSQNPPTAEGRTTKAENRKPFAEGVPSNSQAPVPNSRSQKPVTAVVQQNGTAAIKREGKASEIWAEALDSLAKGSPIYLRLADSIAVSCDQGLLVVELTRKSDKDWILDSTKPQRLGYILKGVHKAASDQLRIEFRVSKDGTRNNEPDAVELPAEGPQLARYADEEFGS